MNKQAQVELLSDREIDELMPSVPDWTRGDDVISREFRFENIRESMAFAEKVVDLAEEQAHHPDIYISINYVTLVLSTHKVGGLTQKDFQLAQAIDRLI
ncbi:MAG: 4a-hydroxytetrahydrobiopterin dehydratase [Gaiellaceae bacterium]